MIGVAASNSIMSNGLKAGLSDTASDKLRAKAELIVEKFSSPNVLLRLMTEDGLAEELSSAYVKDLSRVWWFLFAVSCVGLLSSNFI